MSYVAYVLVQGKGACPNPLFMNIDETLYVDSYRCTYINHCILAYILYIHTKILIYDFYPSKPS